MLATIHQHLKHRQLWDALGHLVMMWSDQHSHLHWPIVSPVTRSLCLLDILDKSISSCRRPVQPLSRVLFDRMVLRCTEYIWAHKDNRTIHMQAGLGKLRSSLRETGLWGWWLTLLMCCLDFMSWLFCVFCFKRGFGGRNLAWCRSPQLCCKVWLLPQGKESLMLETLNPCLFIFWIGVIACNCSSWFRRKCIIPF